VNEINLTSTYLHYNTSAKMDKAMDNLITDPPSQKPPPSLEAALKTETSDAPIVGIGRQQEDTMSSLATSGTCTSTTSDVKDDNDRLIAANPSNNNTTQPTRKRPAADPKHHSGASDSTGIINLCDDDIKEEEEEDARSLIKIDDDTEFPSLSASPPSPSPTEKNPIETRQ
jgi:hypothetical protein